MKFAYIPKASYTMGQVISVHGKSMLVESFSHTGKNVVVHSMPDAEKFERILCITTDNEPIVETRE